MKNITLKKAVIGDAGALADIEKQHKTAAGWGFEAILSELRQENSIIIKAAAKGKIIGFIAAKIIPPEAQITNIAIDKKYLRKSVATKLIESLIKKSKKLKCSKATLEVNSQNTPAFKLYSKIGFKVVGKRPKFYNGKNTALLMDLNYV